VRLFTKKFEQLLNDSKEHDTMKERVLKLESQVITLAHTLGELMQAYSSLARQMSDNHKSLGEIMTYLTDPDRIEDDPSNDMNPNELAEYKRNLN
jgi:CO dehydrogenase/acetyl-CoA synthase epsilon subunit